MALSIALKWAMKCWDIGVLEQSEKAPMPETQKCPMTGRNGCGLAASMTSWGLLGSLGTYQDLAGWLGAFWHLLGSPGNFETLGPHGLWGGTPEAWESCAALYIMDSSQSALDLVSIGQLERA